MRNTLARFGAAVLTVLLVTVLVSSTFLVLEKSEHICTGDDCPICTMVERAEGTRRALGSTIQMEAASILFRLVLLLAVSFSMETGLCSTLLVRGVRLNS